MTSHQGTVELTYSNNTRAQPSAKQSAESSCINAKYNDSWFFDNTESANISQRK